MIRTAALLIVLTISPCAAALADEASHKAAAQELFKTMHMEEMMSKSIDAMLDQQVKANPSMAAMRQVMSAFLQKHMSWKIVEPEMTKVYMEEFTEPELREITAFYKTPLGQKVIMQTPTLMSKGAEIGRARVQANLAELQKMMLDEEARQRQQFQPIPGGPATQPPPAQP